MSRRSGKFNMRIRKMKPEPITVKRRRRQAWGKYEKKEETVLGTLLVSLICFQIFCISRKNRYAEGNDDDDEIPTRSTPGQAQVGGNNVAGTVGTNGSFSSAIIDNRSTVNNEPNLIRVLGYAQSSSTLEYPGGVSPSLPGAVGEADPPAVTAIAAPTSFPLVSMTQRAAGGQALGLGDLELTSLPSYESLSSTSHEDKKENDKKQKKDKKKKGSKKEKQATAVEQKKKSSKAKKDKKKSSKVNDDPSSKIPSVKEWAKQEEEKKKAEKKQQKKELKQEKKKQKQVEKQAAKAEKQKKAQKLKEEKEIKKAEKEAAKLKKAAEKAEKAAAKAKEAAAKAEAKKKEKHSKWERRMQQMLDESDKQMAAYLNRGRTKAEERRRKQEDKAREMIKSIAKTEQLIKALKEKVENKEKKLALLSARRDGSKRLSMMAAFKLNYKIASYNRRIDGIGGVVNNLKKKVEAKREEVEKLAPHLLETEIQEDEPVPCCSKSLDQTVDDIAAADSDSILDMLSYFDSESDYSDDDEDEEELPIEGVEGLHPNIQELLRKAQKHLEKMDEAGAYDDDDEPSYVGKGKGPSNRREYIKKHL